MASHRLKSLYAIKECSSCGSLYTRECCSIGSLENKILVPEPDSSPCCAKCGTPVDGPYCHGCALLRKKFEEDLLTYCVENGIFQDSQDTSESSDDNTNVINAPREPFIFPFVYEQEPCYNQNFNDNYYPQNSPSFSQQYLCCAYCGGPHYDYQCQPINETYYEPNPSYDYSGFDHPQPPQDSVDCQEALDKILEELEEIKRDQRMLKELKNRIAEEQTAKENMSIEEMRHEQQLVDYKIKEIMNDLGYKRFRGEKIDEKDCEIRIRKLKQDSNEWGREVRKKEQAYEEEKYSAARRRMLSIPFVDEDDFIPFGDIVARYSTSKAIIPALSPEEPADSLIMEDEHLDTIPKTESDEFIKCSVENLVQNPSESADLSDGESACDVPINDDSPESHFTTFSNPLFNSNNDFSSDDESLSEEEIQKDEFKYFSNPLCDLDDEIITNEKILPNQKDLDVVIPIPPGIDKHCFNAESDLLESQLNRDSPIDSTKIDSIFDEFSLPRPPEESNS
ncbi:hypothetical protein Tco_0998523 [Tanacetum coccineum]